MKNHPSGASHQDLIPRPHSARAAAARTESSGPNLHDILYILYRHKWKILFFGLVGLTAAAVIWSKQKPVYQSQAKLFVPYVLGRVNDDLEAKVTAGSGAVLNVQKDLITSWDLLESVAVAMTPKVIVPEAGDAATVPGAAHTLLANLNVEVPKGSFVMTASYQHPDPQQARAILTRIVEEYLVKHKETYRPGSAFESVDRKVQDASSKLDADRIKLEKLKQGENIISLTAREQALTNQQANIEAELLAAEARRAEQIARVETADATAGTLSKSMDSAAPAVAPPSPADISSFRSLTQQVESLKMRASELRLRYTPSNPQIRTAESRIADGENRLQEMLKKFPGLAATVTQAPGAAGPLLLDPRVEREALAQIEARIAFLQEQKKNFEKELGNLLVAGRQISQLERDIQEREANYRYYNSALERARVDNVLKPSDLENITVIQQPSVASPAPAGPGMKLAMGLGVGGFAFGIALALLIELFLDRSVKRPQELESKLHIPLMLSIPFLSGRKQLADGSGSSSPSRRLGNGSGESSELGPVLDSGGPTPWGANHFIRPFADAIRDRIGYQFHVNGVTHKPKIIGLTGFSGSAGTSTLAAALAASFAEMTDGKVLYVNLNGGTPLPAPLPGSNGVTADEVNDSGLAREAISLVEKIDNLSVATITPGRDKLRNRYKNQEPKPRDGGQSFIPKHLYQLMPRLRESDYDYVIFDMPALSPTSPTVALAGFLDKVLLVVDAGKTDRDVISRAYRELSSNPQADVSTILNKTRHNLPAWLQG